MTSHDLEAFLAMQRAAERRGLRVVLVGAIARQLVFDRLHREDPYRATRDIDAVVGVRGWDEYDKLVGVLSEHSDFRQTGDHHMIYREGTEVDLLPFGGVADEHGNLTWSGGDRKMSLDGLETADQNSVLVAVDDTTVRVASLPSLVAMKLFAHRDRADREPKDLGDLIYILEHATRALEARVFHELGGELAELEYDEAGPYLLGREIAAVAPASEVDALLDIVGTRILVPPLYRALIRVMGLGDLERAIRQFEALRRGLIGTRQPT
jgi:predicted nucleotidyltransferase